MKKPVAKQRTVPVKKKVAEIVGEGNPFNAGLTMDDFFPDKKIKYEMTMGGVFQKAQEDLFNFLRGKLKMKRRKK